MLEGKNINLRVVEKEDLPLLQEWWNDPSFAGIYNPLLAQESRADIQKDYEKLGSEKAWFLARALLVSHAMTLITNVMRFQMWR